MNNVEKLMFPFSNVIKKLLLLTFASALITSMLFTFENNAHAMHVNSVEDHHYRDFSYEANAWSSPYGYTYKNLYFPNSYEKTGYTKIKTNLGNYFYDTYRYDATYKVW